MRKALHVFLFLLSLPSFCLAEFLPSESVSILGTYTEFSGAKNESWGSSSTSFGVELLAKKGNKAMAVVGGVGIGSAAGTETLLDGATEVECDISAYLADINLGLYFPLIPADGYRIKPYIGVLGTYEIIYSRIADTVTLTELGYSETTSGTGYSLVAGFEFYIGGTSGKGGKAIVGEFRSRSMKAKIHDQSSFSLDGISLVFGYSF